MHVQAPSSALRKTFLASPADHGALARRASRAPARQTAVSARATVNTATSNNFVWRNFPGIEENPNGQKSFLGDTGPSREASIFSLMRMLLKAFVLKQTAMQTKIVLLVFKRLG